MSHLVKTFIAALVAAHGALAVGTPFGYATGTTGGGNAAPSVPSSPAQLVSWLGDNIPRGNESGTICKPWTCSPGAQVAIDVNGWCGREQKQAETTTATWKKAGRTAINVGSNKTLLGKGAAGWIKGKGLRIAGSSNIIIQNVRFSDINAPFVWGGDALTIDGGKQIWIDHNYFKDVGRQFIVTGYGAAQGVTISDNVFDGSGTYSRIHLHLAPAVMAITTGPFTSLALKIPSPSLVTTSTRLLVAALESAVLLLTLRSYTCTTTTLSISPTMLSMLTSVPMFCLRATTSTGSSDPRFPGRSGIVFAPTSGAMNGQCRATLGRDCASNTLLGSGPLADAANANAIGYFNNNVVKSASVMDPSRVGAYVQSNAGTGKIN
ncbi:hypothetical protein OPQ81_002792 [Rhizoctonia solani]|nr:hypothetical protein OPQ81_002792 [Rhizoctonia solani]